MYPSFSPFCNFLDGPFFPYGSSRNPILHDISTWEEWAIPAYYCNHFWGFSGGERDEETARSGLALLVKNPGSFFSQVGNLV
jgi:hypothetical protein